MSSRTAPNIWSHRRLIALTVLPVVVETALMRAFALGAGMAPQATALGPFAVFHDLRWVLVYARSWPELAADVVALLALRSVLFAAIVRAAWPSDRPRPSWPVALRTALGYTAFALVCLLPCATLMFAAAAVSLSWLPIAAIPLLVCFSLLLAHGPTTESWWARVAPVRSMGWVLLTFVQLSLASTAIELTPGFLAVLAGAASGLFNAWAWHGVVHATTASPAPAPRPSRPLRRFPVVPAAVVALAAISLVATGLVLQPATAETPSATAVSAHRPPHPVPVLVAHGFGSRYDGTPHDIGLSSQYLTWQFSYRGLGPTGPRPYTAEATHQSLGALAVLMDEQVRALARRTGQPVRIVAVSEGAMVARTYLQDFPDAPVARLVLLSPLTEPGRAYYPPRGDNGWGLAGAWSMRALGQLISRVSDVDLSPDTPFLRSVVEHAPALGPGLLCPAPGAPVTVFLPLASVALAGTPSARVPIRLVPGFHGDGVRLAAQVAAGVGAHATESRVWHTVNRVLRGSASAWTTPRLPRRLNDAWKEPQQTRDGCPTTGWPQPPSARGR